jgi:hypothetical protein
MKTFNVKRVNVNRKSLPDERFTNNDYTIIRITINEQRGIP